MSWSGKVIWSEGLFLQPQHFQQHERYLQALVEQRVAGLRPYPWGFTALKIDPQQLLLGKIALLECAGVMPDGTPFARAGDEAPPPPLDVPADARDALVVLALPLRRPGVPSTASGDSGGDGLPRYAVVERDVTDSDYGGGAALMQLGQLRLRVALEPDVVHAHATMGVARVVERRADNRLVLDPDYSSPCLEYRVAPPLAALVDELAGMLHQRGDALAARLTQPGTAGAAEIQDFLLLQLVNRFEPIATHLATATGVHPETLFSLLVGLAGELATFSKASKRPVRYPIYRHDQLKETFRPLIDDLRASLRLVVDAAVVPLRLEERRFGVRVAAVPDVDLYRSASFVLAVQAQVPPDAIRAGFAQQVKVGPVEKIRDLVNLALPGIALRPLPVAPRQLPFHAGFTYFELDRGNDLWKQLPTSAGFALHVAGEFPGLQMEFWAIRR